MINLEGKTLLKIAGSVFGGTALVCSAKALYDHLTRYDAQGFDKAGYDREGFDRYGYNSAGYNRAGYNIDGFNSQGYDKQGFDCKGLDRRGFNRAGFDAEGFDRHGRDAEGYCRNGFDRNGYNREGYDRQGYNRNFYSATGFDRAGRTKTQYIDLLGRLYVRLNDAQHQLDIGEFRYAVNDARLVMEETLRLIVEHAGGIDYSGDCLLENLKICENNSLLKEETAFINRLHSVRHICNAVTHELDASNQLTHQKTYFVIMQIHDLLKSAEKTLCCAEGGENNERPEVQR